MDHTKKLLNSNPFRQSLKISLIYFFISTIWIVVTDLVNAAYQHDGFGEYLFEIGKGLLFVAITSVIMFLLLKKYLLNQQTSSREIIERESEYRSLTERLKVGIIRGTPDGKYILMNNAARTMLKDYLKIKPGEDITGLRPEDIYSDQELVERVKKTINFISETGEGIVRKATYGDMYLQVHSYPEHNEKGEFVSMLSILTDETEITRSLHKLEESERFNSHLVNSSHVVVYVYDLKNRSQVYANKALEWILGYSLEEIRGPQINILVDLMHPEDALNMVKYVQTEVIQLKDGEAAEFEYRMKHKAGHYCWFRSHDCIFKRDENGQPLEILGSAIDISDLKKVQEEVKKKSEYLNAVIEASPMSIFDVNPEGRILSIWNKASEKMFGWKAEESIGQILPIVPEEKLHEFEENLKLIVENKFLNGKELVRIKKDGTPITLKLYSRPVSENDGRVDAIIAFTEDITLEKKLNNTIIKSEEYLRILYEATLAANNAVNTNEIYRVCFGYIEKVMNVTGIMISLVTDDRKNVKYAALRVEGEDVDASQIPLMKLDPLGKGPQTNTILTGKPQIVDDLEKRVENSNYKFFIDTSGNLCDMDDGIENVSKSAIMIPLKYEDTVIGVLQVQSNEKSKYTDEDLHKLEPFAFIFASAIQRARLYKKLQSELAEKAAAFEQIRKFTKGIENSPNSILITNAKYEIEYVNPYFTELTGYSAEEVIGRNPNILKSGETAMEVYESLWSTLDRGEIWHGEFLNVKKNGDLYWEAASIGPITDGEGKITHYIAIKQDITDKKKKDKELKDTLEEKEIMLKEIHHRVKNNLQVISSLLNMQVDQYEHPEAIDAINSSRNRVKAMALVHENLYHSRSIGKTSLREYLIMLAKNIYSSYGVSFERVIFKCETNGIEFGLDTIIPLGLILNEGISNSLKHAFPGDIEGEISILLEHRNETGIDVRKDNFRNDCFRLRIKDNGKGLPADFDAGKANTLGMTLLTSLAAQLDGEAVINNKVGTEIVIDFKELKYKSRV